MHNSGRMMLTVSFDSLARVAEASDELKKIAGVYLADGNESAGHALRTTSEAVRDLRI